MSWFRAAPENASPGDQDVFDEEADESLLAQREWQGHMRKRVQVNGRDAGERDSQAGPGGSLAGARTQKPGRRSAGLRASALQCCRVLRILVVSWCSFGAPPGLEQGHWPYSTTWTLFSPSRVCSLGSGEQRRRNAHPLGWWPAENAVTESPKLGVMLSRLGEGWTENVVKGR
jgi:hypothetical protein